MAKMNAASELVSDARTTRHSGWQASLIVAPLLAVSLAASALFGVMAAPQVAGFIGHTAPTSHSALAITPSILGGPEVP